MTEHRPNRSSLPVTRQRLFLAALAFSGGILAASSLPGYRPPLWWLLAALLFASSAILLRSATRIQGTFALLSIASLGALALQLSSNASTPSTTSLDGNELEIVAQVTRDGVERPGFFGSPRQVVELETEAVTLNGVAKNVATGIRASVYQRNKRSSDDESEDSAQSSSALKPLLYGERIRCTAKLRTPHNYGNAGEFDYRGYLESRGITYLASIDSATIEPLSGFSGTRIADFRARLMRRLLQSVNALWEPRDAALTAAMLLGDTTGLE